MVLIIEQSKKYAMNEITCVNNHDYHSKNYKYLR